MCWFSWLGYLGITIASNSPNDSSGWPKLGATAVVPHIIPQTPIPARRTCPHPHRIPSPCPVANSALNLTLTSLVFHPAVCRSSFALSPRLLAKEQGPSVPTARQPPLHCGGKMPAGTLCARPAASATSYTRYPRALGDSLLPFLPLPFLALLPSP